MDQLAPELLGAIVDLLDLPELARLLACSKALQTFTEPVLYGTESNRAQAIHWACAHGNLDLIRKAITTYGATPHAIARPATNNPEAAISVLLTVYLAAKHQQADAFLLLTSLGAEVALPSMRYFVRNQVKKTTRWLARHPALLQAYLDARYDDQVRIVHCPAVAWPLVPAIRAGSAPPALVRLLVERGANPNQVVGGGRGRAFESPLSVAIARGGSRELFDVLVEKGADIHGREILPPSRARAPTQIPVFAAAELMATSTSSPEKGRLMMDLCLGYGADINQHACVSDGEGKFHGIVPLLGYLDSVPWGDAVADLDRQHHQEVLDGISHFFDHGATGCTPIDKCPPRPRRLSAWHCRWIEMPYPIEMLLDMWKLHSLTHNRYFSIIELLAQRMNTNVVDLTRRLLRKHAYKFKPKEPWSADVRAGWRRLLELLFTQEDADLNLLLFHIIVDKGQALVYSNPSFGLGILYQMAVESLLARGADINTLNNPKGTTAIHDLCEFYSWSASNGSPILKQGTSNPIISEQRYLLFDLLMRKGADPTIVVKGKTAIDLVLSRVDRTTPRCMPFVLELAAIMRTDHRSDTSSSPGDPS